MRRKLALLAMLIACLPLLTACGGGTEIDRCLFVLALAVDPAQDGSLTITVKALSGSQDAPESGQGGQSGGGGDSAGGKEGSSGGNGSSAGLEATEPGYITMSATATSCLRALSLLSATTPRTFDLSQLREVVISHTVAQTDATLTILREIYSMFRANGAAIVVVTPNNAGDFIRKQRPALGVRLSQHLDVLFEHFAELDTIPKDTTLSSVISAMESSVCDATAVYAADNDFENTLILPGDEDLNRLPGHLPRTAPVQAEYIGTALFSGARLTGVLTGDETRALRMLLGNAERETTIIGGAQYKVNATPRVKRRIAPDGALEVSISCSYTFIEGERDITPLDLAAEIERRGVLLINRMQAANSDAACFGHLAVRRFLDVPSWEAFDWRAAYRDAPVRVSAKVTVL